MTKQLGKSTKKFSVLFMVASIAGIVISASLLKEDVLSTAHTLTVFFPMAFGVTPAMTENGGIYLGIFISIAQIVGVAVFSASHFSKSIRAMAFVVVLLAVPFDAWTDIVYRSGYLSGNLMVATITTMAFYTLGSEIMQALSLALLVSVWRQGFTDTLWGIAYGWNSLGTMRREWLSFASAAKRMAERESLARVSEKNTYQAESRSVQQSSRPTQRSTGFQSPLLKTREPAYRPQSHDLGREIDEMEE